MKPGFPKKNQAFRAETVLTMVNNQPPLRDGVLITDQGRIQAVLPFAEARKQSSLAIQDLGPFVLVPGLINAHTHLELSHLKGQTIAGRGFTEWVKSLIRQPLKGIDQAVLHEVRQSLRANTTLAVGDISGHSPRTMLAFLSASGLFFRLYIEQIGFGQAPGKAVPGFKGLQPERHPEVCPYGHALYSTHPQTLQLSKAWCREQGRTFVLHLAEHAGESELLATGRGEFAELLKTSLLPESFVPPGMSPVVYADALGLLDRDTLAVHLVQVSPADIAVLKARGVTACLCPRSNDYINVGRAPAEQFLDAGLPICLATDSLASNADLDLWSEAAFFVQHLTRGISLQDLVAMLTVTPARALGLEGQIGTLEPGKAAGFSLVPDTLRRLLPLQ
jgi:cytosine/adenosine deaminase-related metal-dependent hydrolase